MFIGFGSLLRCLIGALDAKASTASLSKEKNPRKPIPQNKSTKHNENQNITPKKRETSKNKRLFGLGYHPFPFSIPSDSVSPLGGRPRTVGSSRLRLWRPGASCAARLRGGPRCALWGAGGGFAGREKWLFGK